jgi:hypothetical protein
MFVYSSQTDTLPIQQMQGMIAFLVSMPGPSWLLWQASSQQG